MIRIAYMIFRLRDPLRVYDEGERRKLGETSLENHRDHSTDSDILSCANLRLTCQRFRQLIASHYSLFSKPMSILSRPSGIASNIYLGCIGEVHAGVILSRYQIVAINSPGVGSGKRKRDTPQVLHRVLDPRESPLIATPNQIVPDVVRRGEAGGGLYRTATLWTTSVLVARESFLQFGIHR